MILDGETLLRDMKTGIEYTKITNSSFGIGQGGYGGPRGPLKPSFSPPTNRQPDAVHTFRTTLEVALLYRLCGDYNPLHADDEFGRSAGFKGAIIQGLGTWNIVAHGVLQEFGGSDPDRFKSFKARFASVVYPGEMSLWISE
jgi:peroxisomal enoyl-CoA hydratase 2